MRYIIWIITRHSSFSLRCVLYCYGAAAKETAMEHCNCITALIKCTISNEAVEKQSIAYSYKTRIRVITFIVGSQ